MSWELVVWVALAVGTPALAAVVWPRLQARLPGWAPYLRSFAPWLHGIVPAYGALLTAAVSERNFGIAVQPWPVWAGGALACGILLAAYARIVPPPGNWPKPSRGVLDEPRWALYRAAGILGAGNWSFGLLIGLALAAAEAGLRALAQPGRRSYRWETLARAAGSALIFAVTANFWLTLITQAIALYLLRRRPG